MDKIKYTFPEAAKELKIQRHTLIKLTENLGVKIYNTGHKKYKRIDKEGFKTLKDYLSRGIFIPMRQSPYKLP